jgi:hypothetical protein
MVILVFYIQRKIVQDKISFKSPSAPWNKNKSFWCVFIPVSSSGYAGESFVSIKYTFHAVVSVRNTQKLCW